MTGTPSARRCARASKEKTGESYTMLTKEMSRAVGRSRRRLGKQKSPLENDLGGGGLEATRGPESKSHLENEGSQGCRRIVPRSHA